MFSFFNKSNINSKDVNELEPLLGEINLIDVREPKEYDSGHIPTAKNIPMNDIVADSEKHLDKLKEYHIICQSGGRSSKTCSVLKEKGFNVVNVTGGTGGYRGRLKK